MGRHACLLVSALAVAGGCGGDGEREASDPAAVTVRQLASMPLPAAAFGSAAAGLRIDADESGYNDNAAAADDTIDPDDTGAELAGAGRRTGYDLSFADSDLSSLRAGAGTLYASSGVELFRRHDQARAYMKKQVRDHERLTGREVEEGIRLLRAHTRELAGLGDGAWRVDAVYSLAGREVHEALVAFTLGRLVGAVGIVRVATPPRGAEIERLARVLERRIRSVAAGKLDARPVPIPPRPAGNRPTGDARALEGMVLTLEDVTTGAAVQDEGFRRGQNGLWTYGRIFDLRRARRGPVYLSTDVELYPSETEADAALDTTRAVFRGKSGERFFARTFGREAGFRAKDVRIVPLRVPRIGDANVVGASFSTSLGRFRGVFAFLRSGRVVGSLYAFGPAARFRHAEAVPLVRRLAARIAERAGSA